MKIPSYVLTSKPYSILLGLKSKDFEDLLAEKDYKSFINKLISLKKQLKSENNDPGQIIAILDAIDVYLAEKIAEIIEIREKRIIPSNFDKNQFFQALEGEIMELLRCSNWILMSKTYNRAYKSLDRLLKILIICDNFDVLSECMLLLYGYFSDDTITALDYMYMQSDIEDLLYICKYALNHRNTFNSKATFQFTDYFHDDPRYKEYIENIHQRGGESMVFEGYNSAVDVQFLLKKENFAVFEENLKKLAEKENLINSLEITKFLIKYHNLQGEIDWNIDKCLNKRVFYGLLYRVKFSLYHPSYEARMKGLSLILFSLQTYVALTKFFSIEKNNLLNEIFVTNLDFGNVLKEILNLFHLELNPEFHTKVILSILNILSLDEHFDFKEYMNQINNQFMFLQRLLKDCITRKVIQQGKNVILAGKREKSCVLSEKTALNPRFLKKLLLLLKKEIKQFYLDEDNNIITTQIYSMCTLLSSLMEINDSEPFILENKAYFPYSYKHFLILNEILWNFIPNQDLLNNYNLFQKLIDRLHRDLELFLSFSLEPASKFLVFTKNSQWEVLESVDLCDFVEYMLKLIDSPFFRKISMRNQMVPTLARKIADSPILLLLKALIDSPYHKPSMDKIFLQTIILVGDIAREIPGLIDRLIELGIMKSILLQLDETIPHNVEMIPMIIYFINMLCLNEQGQLMERSLDTLSNVFKLFIRRDFIEVLNKNIGHNGNKCPSSMAYEFLEMLNSVEKMKPRVCELILWTFKQMIDLKDYIISQYHIFHERKGLKINVNKENNDKITTDEIIEKNIEIEDFEKKQEFPPKNKELYKETFPMFNKDENYLNEDFCAKKEFIDSIRDYNKMLQNFLRFFSRFFSVNCNIIDELITGHCIDFFLRLMDSPLLLFTEKQVISHSLTNCYKVFIMNIYKMDLNEKLTEEIQKVLTNLEDSFSCKFDQMEDFSSNLPEILEIHYIQKSQLDEKTPLQGNILVLGKLLFLENLSEFLRLMIASKHFHTDDNISNEALLHRLRIFLNVLLKDIERLNIFLLKHEFDQKGLLFEYLEENSVSEKYSIETLKKVLCQSHSLFHILKKIYIQNIKELMDTQIKAKKDSKKLSDIMELLCGLLLDTLNKEMEPFQILRHFEMDDQINAFFNLFHHYHQLMAFREIFNTVIEIFKKNLGHPEFLLIFYRNYGFEKIMGYLHAFLKLLQRFFELSHEKKKTNGLLLEMLKKVHDEMTFIIKPLFFYPLELGNRVYFPENNKYEDNEGLLEYIDSITLENIEAFKLIFIEMKDIYIFSSIFKDFKPILEVCIGLITKALKLNHRIQKKRPKNQGIIQKIMDDLIPMGFAKERIQLAIENVDIPNISNITEWLFAHVEMVEKPKEEEEEKKDIFENFNIIERGQRLYSKKEVKNIKKEDFFKEKQKIFINISDDFIGKIYYCQQFEKNILDFLVAFLERPEFDEIHKEFSNKYMYLILRGIKMTSQNILKKFNFKLNLKGNREILEVIRSEGEFLKEIPENIFKTLNIDDFFKGIRNLNILLPFYARISLKFDKFEKNSLKIKPALEILKIVEKLLEKENIDDFLKNEKNPSNFKNLQEFILKVLIILHQVLENQEKNKKNHEKPKKTTKKLRSKQNPLDKEDVELKELYNKLIPLMINLIAIHNNNFDKNVCFLDNSIFLGILNLLKLAFQGNRIENMRLFISKKGLVELLKLKDSNIQANFSDFSEVFRKIIENLLNSDEDLMSAHYELEIKRFFLDIKNFPLSPEKTPKLLNEFRKNVPLNEFLTFAIEQNSLNLSIFESTAKRLCVRKPSKTQNNEKNENSVKISLRSEALDISRILVQKGKNNRNISNISIVHSIFQPYPDTHMLVFSEKGLLMSIIPSNLKDSSQKPLSSKEKCSKMKKSSKKQENTENTSSKAPETKPLKEDDENMVYSMKYLPSEQISLIIGLFIDTILYQFLEEITGIEKMQEENTLKMTFSYTFLIKLLHAIIHKFPILTPFVLRYNCAKHIKKHQKVLSDIGLGFGINIKEISFLTFLMRILLPLTLDKFRHIIFEICLDSYIYCPIDPPTATSPTQELVPFSQEIRKKVLLELFFSLENELFLTKSQGILHRLAPNNNLLSLITLHVYLLPIKDIAKLSLNWLNPANTEKFSLNFIKLYEEFFKLFEIKDIYVLEAKLDVIKEPLSILYQYLLAFILNKKGITSLSSPLMPQNILSKLSSLIYEWEYMMNPTIFNEISLDNSHIHIEETSSSYSNDIDNDYSIDTFMNEIYQYHPDGSIAAIGGGNADELPQAEIEGLDSDYDEEEDIEEDIENLTENIENQENEDILNNNTNNNAGLIHEPVSSDDLEDIDEDLPSQDSHIDDDDDSSEQSSSSGFEGSEGDSSGNAEQDISDEGISSSSEDDDEGDSDELSEEDIEENTHLGHNHGHNMHRFFVNSEEHIDQLDSETESEEDDDENEDEIHEMRTEREIISQDNESNNRRRFLGSVNFIFRRDRLDNEDRRIVNRLRLRKAEKKKKPGFDRSLTSILTFDYMQFDPEIQRINDVFLNILKISYQNDVKVNKYLSDSSIMCPIFLIRLNLYTKITALEVNLLSTPLSTSWAQLFPNNMSIQSNISSPTEIVQRENLPQRTRLNWDFLMNSGNGMVMFVSGRDPELMELNSTVAAGDIASRRPEISGLTESLNARRMAFRNLFHEHQQRLEPEVPIREYGNNAEYMNNHNNMQNESNDRNTLRDRLIRELSDEVGIEEEQEEEEKKEDIIENIADPNNISNNNQIDPMFLDIINEEFKHESSDIPNINQILPQTINRPPSNNLQFRMNSLTNFNNPLNISNNNNNNNIERGQGPSLEFDNASFFASLPENLREEVILSSDPAFLGTLPPELLSQFQGISEHSRGINNMNHMIYSPPSSDPLSSDSERPKKKKLLKKDRKSGNLHKQKEILMKNTQNSRILLVEEKILENIVNFLYVDSLAFRNFPYTLMKSLMMHPVNELKLLDCFMGLLKGEIPTQDIFERDCVLQDKKKIFLNISLKILTILAIYTKHSISGYFLEKPQKSLILEKSVSPTTHSALHDLIRLLGNREFLNSYVHLKLLIALISNISKKVRLFNERKTQENEKFHLDECSVVFLCNVLNSDILDEKSLKNLNNIISVFSLNKNNLHSFVSQMKLLLLGICQKMNESLEENLIGLRKVSLDLENHSKEETEENLINRLETEIEEEHKIYRIFKIIKRLFEKCLMKSNNAKMQEEIDSKDPFLKMDEEEKSDPIKKPPLPESSEPNNNAELRKTFNILISDRALNNVWINVTELLILINEVCPKSINLSNPIIHKMTPIIECFFIIYRILNDEEASFETLHRQSSHALRKYYARKTMPEISALIHNELPQCGDELDMTNFLNNREKLTFNDMFTIMCEKNKNIINLMVKQNISLLNESFSMIIKKMPKILDFDNKKNYFRLELKKLKPQPYTSLRLKVKRNKVFIDSYNAFNKFNSEDLRRKLIIEFINEPGVDQGGLIREFYSLVSREIFNPGYCLFKTSANNVTFQPSPQSHINDQHLNYFKFVGRIFGKALHDGFMMDAFFTRSFYKHMLGQSLTIYDMEDIDPEYFKNLKWILENDISGFELTFSYESDNFGKIEIVDLIANGRNIPVTEENKLDYVQKICYAKMAKDIQEQIKKFLEGFHELIPPPLVSIFDSRELELMISGLPDIDIQDLQDNTEYINYSKDSKVIVWLWDILSNLDKSDKAAFLQFVTGTSKVPLEGFKGLRGANGPKKFNIQKCFDVNKLPSSHTCFNQLDLPDYETKEILRERLLIAIREGKEFGFM